VSYAKGTAVAVDRSRAELERTLSRYGASAFAYGWDGPVNVITFRAHGRIIRFTLRLPPPEDFQFTPRGQRRHSQAAIASAHDQEIRRRWRALVLVVKAKLEAVESGIATFEDEFLSHILLPDSTTVGEWIGPQIEEVYATGTMPSLLPTRPALEAGDA
jgi:hypothetical protein